MDAQELKPGSPHGVRPLPRLVIAWLSVLLAIGLWQGYGLWLLNGGTGDVLPIRKRWISCGRFNR